MRKVFFCFNNQEARAKRMRHRFGGQKLNLRRLQPEMQRQRIYELFQIKLSFSIVMDPRAKIN